MRKKKLGLKSFSDNCTENSECELNDYWRQIKRSKNTSELGRLYEQYVGYLYEDAGYKVEYRGIDKGNNDGGIDLICKFGSIVILVQCKYRTENNVTISTKDILQFCGVICYYSVCHPKENVEGAYYTTAHFSLGTYQVAKRLGIMVYANYGIIMPFPIVKCKYKRMEYFLPNDWEYETTRINLQAGDCYCLNTVEANSKGFIRPYAHTINKK